MTTEITWDLKSVEVLLDWYDETETVVVTPRDQQRFEIQKDVAIEALRVQHGRAGQFNKQVLLMLQNIGMWMKEHGNDIQNAYLTLQDDAFAFVVVRKVGRYDAAFEDALSELDFALANDPALSLIKLHAIALPPASQTSLHSFLDKRLVFVFPTDGK
jgi:hypothetical protein